jgi:drug/metabolite transporter (DMT)-like permease
VLNYQIIPARAPTIAATGTYLLLVVAIVLDVLVLSEGLTAIMLAGVALVLVGVALTRRHARRTGARSRMARARSLTPSQS